MYQPGILLPPPRAGHFLVLHLQRPEAAEAVASALASLSLDESLVIGLGQPLLSALGASLPGLRCFPALSGRGVSAPSTQGAIWAWLRGADCGEALDRAQALLAALGEVRAAEDVPTFLFRGGRDLSGYEDGTENPVEDAAMSAAFVSGAGPGRDNSSFVAAQRWVHDLSAMARMAPRERDETIGREIHSNNEMPDAPESAHVKRAAQESFDPPAFMLRRSMPWGNTAENGLFFVAFGADLDRYERVMRRMLGGEDGIVDALFRFSRPVSGGYYWCPPIRDGRLDLRAIGR